MFDTIIELSFMLCVIIYINNLIAAIRNTAFIMIKFYSKRKYWHTYFEKLPYCKHTNNWKNNTETKSMIPQTFIRNQIIQLDCNIDIRNPKDIRSTKMNHSEFI